MMMGAMVFDGIDGKVYSDNYSDTNTTYSLWFYAHDRIDGETLIQNVPDDNARYGIQFGTNNNIIVGRYNGASYVTKYATVENNTWYHLTFTWDGTTVLLYLDGVLTNDGSENMGLDGSAGAGSRITIGSRVGTGYFNGSISQTQIYNKALSQTEITEIYTAGKDSYTPVGDGLIAQYSGRDYAGTEATPTTIYDTNHLVDGKINEAFTFDGVDDFVETDKINFSTLSFWIKSNQAKIHLFRFSDAEGVIGTRNNKYSLYNGSAWSESNIIPSLNSWDFVSYVYDTDGYWLYVNGVKDIKLPVNFLINFNTISRGASSVALNGSIDDVRIYNRSLTADEIITLYNDGAGTEETVNAVITLNSPTDNAIAYNNPVTFSASAEVSGGAYLTNATLYNNISGTWEANGTINTIGNITNSNQDNNLTDPTEYSTSSTGFVLEKTWNNLSSRIPYVTNQIKRTTTGTPFSKVKFIYDDLSFEEVIESFSSDSYNTRTYTNPNSSKIVDTIEVYLRTNNAAGSAQMRNIYVRGENPLGIFNRTITGPTSWNVEACDSDGDCGFSSANFTVFLDEEAPSINITAPINTLNYNYIGGNETLNVTFTDTNLDSCWYNYNGTNVTIEGCLNSSKFILESSNTNLTVYANDSLGNLNNEFVEWDYKIFENEQIYETEVYETEVSTIAINVTYNPTNPITAILNYDGVNYSSVNAGSESIGYFASSAFNIPLINVSENKTFYWIITTDGSIITTTEINQTISPLIFQICNATYPTQTLNLLFR